jgi:Cd2+/Zn2+-exporting ATPase
MLAVNPSQPIEKIEWSVTGMDCASCAAKIRGVLEPVSGVHEIAVSVMAQTLTVSMDPQDAAIGEIERRVVRLGYGIARRRSAGNAAAQGHGETPCSGDHDHAHKGHTHDHSHSHAPNSTGKDYATNGASALEPQRWFETSKGMQVVVTGGLLGIALLAKLSDFHLITGWMFVVACLVGTLPIARRALAALSMGQPFTIEMLMTIAAVGALAIGAAEEAALVVFLFAVGEVLEGVAADRARASIRDLADLVPATALLVVGDATREIPAASVVPGQVVLVWPGNRIPADGTVESGVSGVDESPVTGESVPKTKLPGDAVYAGSINREASLQIRVTKRAEDNTIARIIRLVEEAQDSKAPTERFIDKFSRIYMPIVVGLALLVAIVPPLATGAEWGEWIYRALALLLIGCPCALVISVPASIASSLSAGARRGLLLKGGAVIEAAARTTVVAFDKTGTLTTGRPVVTDIVALTGSENEAIALTAAVEAHSAHPLARAVVDEAKRRGLDIRSATGAQAVPGRGVSASVGGAQVIVASPRHALELGCLAAADSSRVALLQDAGKTVAVVIRDGATVGLVAFRDEPRPDAAAAIADLKALGIRAVMLTGDNAATATAIAGNLGIEVYAELLPDAKVAAIREFAAHAPVMMIGDGINDAPALAAATVGIAMGSATGVALETADGALMGDRIADAPRLMRLARATMANIRQNIALALGLKAVFLVTSVLGLTGLWIAILADTGATVLVTINALRLLRFNPDAR